MCFSLHNSLSNLSDKTYFLHVELRSDVSIKSCLVKRSAVLVGKAFNVVDELFVDPGAVPKFLLMMLQSYFLWLFSRD